MISHEEKSKAMNNFTHKLYLLTGNDTQYHKLIKQRNLSDLSITENRSEASILLAAPPLAAPCLEDFPNLKWIQSIYAGVDALVPHLDHFSGKLTNVRGIFGQQISEYVLGYLIEYFRQFVQYRDCQQNETWQPRPYQTLSGKKMVVLGTGSIGSHLATTVNQFSITSIGINRSGIPEKNSPFCHTFHIQELATALKQADILVNTLPNTPETEYLLTSEILKSCKNVLLFNVGRGNIIKDEVLLEAINKKSVSHAFLDVFEQEPLVANHPFWQHKDITITPHIAAVSFPEQVVEVFCENYQRWYDGFSLINLIDPGKGY